MCYTASLRALVGTQTSDSDTDFRQELQTIQTPTLIVHGGADRMAPVESTAQKVAQLVRGSSLEIVKDAPHGLPLTHVETLNHLLLSFIRNSTTAQ
ncbi:alpha/beta hydrolase [Acidobacteria bacterium AB60]|nr:alpha/beta hydrolase [Acidobacteria bacterium AB60]